MSSSKANDNRKITIYDIAAEAGVSASTVSRVLTNNVKVNERKRQKILALVEKYNFRPNTFAKGLADARSRNIGILMPDVRNPYYASLFISCEWAARKENYSVSLHNFLSDVQLEEELLKGFHQQRMDAVILLGGREDELHTDMEYVELVNHVASLMPVIITGKLDGTDCDMVRIDHRKTMDLLMEHLLSLGHKKIAILGGRMNVLSTFERIMRYKQLLKESQIPFHPELIGQNGSYDIHSGYTQMNELYTGSGNSCASFRKMPTAVIAINDYAALGIIQSIHEHGQKIPQDISVISYDNTYIAETTVPALTSIDYNYEDYGSVLIKTAIGRLDGAVSPKLQIVEPSLVIRESTARAKSARQEA